MDLFIIDKERAVPSPQALLIPEFKAIADEYSADEALIRFTYIEFMCSYRKTNVFVDYPIEVRGSKILQMFPDVDEDEIKNDELVTAAMTFYTEHQNEASVSLRFYKGAVNAAEKMIDFFDTFDLSATNPRTGALLYKPADITRALKDTNETLKTLTTLKNRVEQELYESAKGKSGREINYFERSKSDR